MTNVGQHHKFTVIKILAQEDKNDKVAIKVSF